MKTIRRSAQGFTLIEMMLVVVIMGILMTIAVVKFSGLTEKSKITATRADITQYGTALKLYELDNGFFPTTDQGLAALKQKPAGAQEPLHWKEGGYLDTPLRDDQWGHPYIYKYPGERNPGNYDLYSAGPNGVPGDADDIANWQ